MAVLTVDTARWISAPRGRCASRVADQVAEELKALEIECFIRKDGRRGGLNFDPIPGPSFALSDELDFDGSMTMRIGDNLPEDQVVPVAKLIVGMFVREQN